MRFFRFVLVTAFSILVVLTAIGPVHAASLSLFDCPDLQIGMQSNCVVLLQQELNVVHASQPPLDTDGIFGGLTQQAVMNFQVSKNLEKDGIVGPITKQALEAAQQPVTPQCYYPTLAVYPGAASGFHNRFAEVDYHANICGNDVNTYNLEPKYHLNNTGQFEQLSLNTSVDKSSAGNGVMTYSAIITISQCIYINGFCLGETSSATFFINVYSNGSIDHSSITYPGTQDFIVFDTP